MSIISNRLLTLRRAKKISQSELGKLANVSREMIGKYERGEVLPSLEIAYRIADVLEVSLDHLVGKDKDRDYTPEVLKLVDDLESLPTEVKEHVTFIVDAVIRDTKARETYS